MSSVESPGENCAACGRTRWEGDRFCAGCGTEFLLPAEAIGDVIDVDGLVIDDDADTASRGKWRDGAKGLGALALVIAVLVGGLYLASSTDSEADDADIDQAADDDPMDASSATDGDARSDQGNDTDDRDSDDQDRADRDSDDPGSDNEDESTPAPRPTPRPAPIAAAFVGADVGARWLIATGASSEMVAHDLVTGALHRTPYVTHRGDSQLYSDGYVKILYPPDQIVGSDQPALEYGSWNGGVDIDVVGGSAIGSFMDPDVGRVLITLVPEAPSPFVATAVETGEQKPLPAEASVLGRRELFWFNGNGSSPEAEAFVTSAAGRVWSWTWEDGWRDMTAGEVLLSSRDGLVVRRCDDPERCETSIVDYSGTTLAESIGAVVPLWSSISPDGQWVASIPTGGPIFFASEAIGVSVLDVTSRQQLEFEVGETFPVFSWTPNSRFLIVAGFDQVTVFDTTEQELLGEFRMYGDPPFGRLVFTDDFEPGADP